MGTFNVPVEIGDAGGQRFELFDALVDTGSTYTVIPASRLEGLGVQPHRTSVFEFAEGRQEEWRMGRAWVRLAGKQEITLVVFGAEGVAPILGAMTLEELSLGANPVKQRLIPVTALLM